MVSQMSVGWFRQRFYQGLYSLSVDAMVKKDGKYFIAIGKNHELIVRSETCSDVINKVFEKIGETGGVITTVDIDLDSCIEGEIPDNILIINNSNGNMTIYGKEPSMTFGGLGTRKYDMRVINSSFRTRDITETPIDMSAIDGQTGDHEFYVNVGVSNLNPNGFLGKNNIPPAYRWINKNSPNVKVFDQIFRDDGILSIRTGDPTIDGNPVVDRFGIDVNGKIYRKNMPPPQFIDPTNVHLPWKVDAIGAVMLYIVVELEPDDKKDAVALFDISPDNVTWFENIVKLGKPINTSSMSGTAIIYVPTGWYVKWKLTNAHISTIFKQYI